MILSQNPETAAGAKCSARKAPRRTWAQWSVFLVYLDVGCVARVLSIRVLGFLQGFYSLGWPRFEA